MPCHKSKWNPKALKWYFEHINFIVFTLMHQSEIIFSNFRNITFVGIKKLLKIFSYTCLCLLKIKISTKHKQLALVSLKKLPFKEAVFVFLFFRHFERKHAWSFNGMENDLWMINKLKFPKLNSIYISRFLIVQYVIWNVTQ